MLPSSLVALVLAAAQPAVPAFERVGATYDIVEADALAEIEDRAAKARLGIEHFGDSDEWTATKSVRLPLAEADADRLVAPVHTLEFDIPDRNGGTLYPAGFTFNVLDYVSLPSRFIITTDDRLGWAAATASPADMILVSGGNALKARQGGADVFALTEQVVTALGLRAVPAVVEQVGTQLSVREYRAESIPVDETSEPIHAASTGADGAVQ